MRGDYFWRKARTFAHTTPFSPKSRILSRLNSTWRVSKPTFGSSRAWIVYVSAVAGIALWYPCYIGGRRWKSQFMVRCDGPEFPVEKDTPVRVESGSRQYASYQPQHHAPGQQPPPDQRAASEEGKDGNQQSETRWSGFQRTLSDIKWSAIPDKIAEVAVPSWIKLLPGFWAKLQRELSMAPDSLAEEIWREANDPECNPEIIWDCSVRVSEDICDQEKAFLQKRKHRTRTALSAYLGIPEKDIHPDDVPTIAICGSGGGLRALVAGSSSYLSAKTSGLFDCTTYTAGVSGSCWLQSLYYSTITNQDHDALIRHLKHRLGVHIAYPPSAIGLLSSAPTNKFLLSGIVEKLKGVPDADFGLVDVYGVLLAARLLVPKGDLGVDEDDLKLSKQARYLDYGQQPLPIYTAVRHEIPLAEQQDKDLASAAEKARKEAWFQWFEFTPYEFWCEEFGSGIPTWSVGREFEAGRTRWRENGLGLPELRTPLLLGIWGSAFCATLSHYYREVKPFMRGLAGFAGIDQLISERDDDLIKVHPIDPATIPNYAHGMRDQLPSSCPESVFSSTHLQLMDAGMSNNLPIYPLLRPGRNVDILIAFDASADVRTDNWLRVVDGYARQRGIKGWPIGAGWPPMDETPERTVAELEQAQAKSKKEAEARIAQAKQQDARSLKPKDLSYCNIWVGTTEERSADTEPPLSKLVDDAWELMVPQAGITVVYFPFLPNLAVPDIDPRTSDFLSTWNFVYTPEQIDKVVALAHANFEQGSEQTRRAVRAVYERKKKKRLEREAHEKEMRRRRKMQMGLLGRKLGEGDHANHFS